MNETNIPKEEEYYLTQYGFVTKNNSSSSSNKQIKETNTSEKNYQTQEKPNNKNIVNTAEEYVTEKLPSKQTIQIQEQFDTQKIEYETNTVNQLPQGTHTVNHNNTDPKQNFDATKFTQNTSSFLNEESEENLFNSKSGKYKRRTC